jgi:hypothetical protein
MAKETRMRPRGDYTSICAFDVHDSVAFDAHLSHADTLQLLPGHRLDWVSPDLVNPHSYLPCPGPP